MDAGDLEGALGQGAGLIKHHDAGAGQLLQMGGLSGKYASQVDRSFRWGMVWFIFSEVMLFFLPVSSARSLVLRLIYVLL